MKIRKIPQGWRKIRKGTTLKWGDCYDHVFDWMMTGMVGKKVGWDKGMYGRDMVYIRQIKKK